MHCWASLKRPAFPHRVRLMTPERSTACRPPCNAIRFTFDAAGLIEKAAAAARGALVGGKVVMMPREGRMSNYQERADMRVPLTGEAAWVAPGGN